MQEGFCLKPRKFRANLVKGGRTAPAARSVMRKALRLEGPVGRTGNRQEAPSDQVLARPKRK